MSQRESSHEAGRDARDVPSFERKGGSKRRRSVFRELIVYSTALNTVRKANSLRSELYGSFCGLLDRICDGILLLRWSGQRKWILPVR